VAAHRVNRSEIRVGQPLPWNVFDAGGVLLLRRGFVIDTQKALDRLIEDGLFVSENDNPPPKRPPPEPEKPSALQLLMDARRLFGTPNQDLSAVRDFPGRVRRIAQLVDQACLTNPDVAIATILLLQDHSYTIRHHINTAIIANLVCRAMSMPEEKKQQVTAAALTMNVSMYEVQDKLNEVKGPLNDKLRGLIAAHPEHSEQRLRKLGVEEPLWLKCVEHHHECENGAGYPKGLSGDDIEQGAKVISLADRYCAQVSIRNYRSMRAPGVVLKDLYTEKGAEINAVVAAYLIRIVSIYPPGTIVRLRNGEIAVVVEPAETADTPVAYAVLGASGAAMGVPVMRNTARDDFKITDVMTLDKVDFPIQMSRLWGNAARL
jgi:HD-GYP domain-containing protein (c-di-GMP phosphodiesterase class II)